MRDEADKARSAYCRIPNDPAIPTVSRTPWCSRGLSNTTRSRKAAAAARLRERQGRGGAGELHFHDHLKAQPAMPYVLCLEEREGAHGMWPVLRNLGP
jgi:hypothetical protein